MRKKILIVIGIILALIVAIGTMYAIDMVQMENNKPVIFSTWGYDYAPPENIDENQTEIDTDNSFIGTILEETTTYMIVEPNEDEIERKSSDKIHINYGEDHIDYLYGVGRKVVIKYDGTIMETYPAQINTNDISAEGYSDFKLSIVEYPNEKKPIKILNNKDLYKDNADYNLYYYGVSEVNVTINNKTLPLQQALESGKITLEGLISKANKDASSGEARWNAYYDGGTKEYYYGTYTIIKKHTIEGNRDVWIGPTMMKLNDISNYE